MWPEYAWIVHSAETNRNCTLPDGAITLTYQHADTHRTRVWTEDILYYSSCNASQNITQDVLIRQIGKERIRTSIDEDTGVQVTVIDESLPIPSDLPPKYVPTLFIILFYTANTACFVICTITLILYFYFRNEPAVKATSVSLSVLIFIGCYLAMFYLYILNSFLLPLLHQQSTQLRNSLCAFRIWLNGLGYPLSLIQSTLLVKLLRVYRLFRFTSSVSRMTKSNWALTVCVLLMTAPNALVCLIWFLTDPYISITSLSIRNGLLHISEECASVHTIRWLLMLLIYMVTLSVLLITMAILTRKIKYRDFKDTKKVSILSFLLVLTCTCTLFYWYVLRSIRADAILVHAVLQIGHYCTILECQGFLFAPKLFPIIKEKVFKRYKATPVIS